MRHEERPTAAIDEIAVPIDLGSAMTKTRRPEITLHQLRIFWTVAHAETLTKAAKQLGLAQPGQRAALVPISYARQLVLRRPNVHGLRLNPMGAFHLEQVVVEPRVP